MLLTLPFLSIVGLVLPFLAWINSRQAKAHPVDDEQLPSLGAMALQAIVLQGIIFGLAWLAASAAGIPISWPSRLGPVPILAAVGIVVVGMAVAWADSRRPPDPTNIIGRVLARSSAFAPQWLALMLAAGITEEFAYRGVLTGMLALWLEPWAAWVVSALAFGFSHCSQGWRGFLGGVAFAIALQGVVFLSGGLLLAIVAHMAYDFGAVWISGWTERQLGSQSKT